MIRRFLCCGFLLATGFVLIAAAQPLQIIYGDEGANWDWTYSSDEGGGGSSYLGVDIDDVSPERLGELKLKEEHGAEVTMVDQDAPAGKAGLHEHDVIVSLNSTAVESAAQLRRMIKETPPGRIITLGISRDGQPLTIKLQLADRHKSMNWEMPALPKIPQINMPDFDNLPVSIVVVHQSARSGLMVENVSPQLGQFFGVKDGKGVLVRSVEKGSSGEKAGFRAGDVVVKVNNQPVHDTSDFTHALRSNSGAAASITVMREKREQNLTLPLPEKKDSGSLLEDSLDVDCTAETEQAINRAGAELARVDPAYVQKEVEQALRMSNIEKRAQEQQLRLQKRLQEVQHRERDMQQRQKILLQHSITGEPAEI